MRRELISHQLELSLQKSFEAPQLRVTEVSGERPVSDERREPRIPIKYGPSGPDDWFGVVPATVRFERAPDAAVEELHLAIKVNPKQGLARTLIPWIIEHQKIVLDRRSASPLVHRSRPALRHWR
jgi:hypothetical protein